MNDVLELLRRVREGPVETAAPTERCDVCAQEVPDSHGHLVDVRSRRLLCSCRGCYLLFTQEGAGGLRYRAVPDRYLRLVDFELSPQAWEALQVPVSVAFFLHNSELGRVAAFYPGPAGATESLLSLESWASILRDNPQLASLRPDVEALLVRVPPLAPAAEGLVVPIDACYGLVGQLRRLWKGFDGGAEARGAIDAFFGRAGEQAR